MTLCTGIFQKAGYKTKSGCDRVGFTVEAAQFVYKDEKGLQIVPVKTGLNKVALNLIGSGTVNCHVEDINGKAFVTKFAPMI